MHTDNAARLHSVAKLHSAAKLNSAVREKSVLRHAWANPAVSPKQPVEGALSEPSHLRSGESKLSRLSVSVENREEVLNLAIAVVIVVNIIFLGIETDFSNFHGSAKDRIFWILVESIMIMIFMAEIMARMYFERWRWPCSLWNWFDVCLVILSITETWILSFLNEHGRLRVLGLTRCVRMLRLIRVFRLLLMFSPLYTTVMAFKEALTGLLSICAIMLGGIYVCAIFITGVVGRGDMRELELGGNTGSERFGSVTWSMYSLFELLTLEGWVEVARPIIEQQPAMVIFFFSFIMMFTFGLLQMVVAVVVEKTLLNAKRTELAGAEKMQAKVGVQLEKLREAFAECDINQDETIDRNEFAVAMTSTDSDMKLKACFEALGIPTDDALTLFDILDSDVSGQLSMQEFLNGVARVLGASDPLWDHLATHALMMGLKKQFLEFHQHIRQGMEKKPKLLTLNSSLEALESWLPRPLTPPPWT